MAATDAGTTYYAQASGGISEANHNRILEAYAEGKNVNIVIAFGARQLTLIPTAHVADNTSGLLMVSCAVLGEDQAAMDGRIAFFCGYDSATGEEPFEYFTSTGVSLCVPKTAD